MAALALAYTIALLYSYPLKKNWNIGTVALSRPKTVSLLSATLLDNADPVPRKIRHLARSG